MPTTLGAVSGAGRARLLGFGEKRGGRAGGQQHTVVDEEEVEVAKGATCSSHTWQLKKKPLLSTSSTSSLVIPFLYSPMS
jgi:hypothetical protein